MPVRIAIIGGGSLNWAHTLMADLAFNTTLDADVRLYDIDRGAAHRNAEIGTHFGSISKGVPARYTAAQSLAGALENADVVVISILPGQFSDMAQDIEIPSEYNIPQAVGDTVGPGGFLRAMRAIPMFVDIAHAIRDHAPHAFVCNLTNPMSVLTGALFAGFPGIKAWGECHEVTKIRKLVADIANQKENAARYTYRDVWVNVLGINHFTFVNRITVDGRDMMPDYCRFAKAHAKTGWEQSDSEKDGEFKKYFGTRNLVAFDLLERFGLPAAAGDRHLAEFLPASEYLSDPDRWGFALTPVDYRIRDRAAKIERAEKMRAGLRAPDAKRSDEALVDQIEALVSGNVFISNVNVPNIGQIANLPMGTIVETNAAFSGGGIDPISVGDVPEPLCGVILDHAQRQNEMLKAVIHGRGAALFDLFRSDPLVAPLKDSDAREMFDRMISATADLIPEALKGAA